MFRIRRFGIIKTATTVAALYMVIIGVIVLIFGGLAMLVGSALPTSGGTRIEAGALLVLLLTGVLIYGVLGWVMTAIACGAYNVVARWVGGIEVEVERVEPPPPVPAWGAAPSTSATDPTR